MKKTKVKKSLKQKALLKYAKELTSFKWYEIKNKEARKLLKDIKNYPEELIDFIMEVKPITLDHFVELVNIWVHFETKMTGSIKRDYSIGQGEWLFGILKRDRFFWDMKNILEYNQ